MPTRVRAATRAGNTLASLIQDVLHSAMSETFSRKRKEVERLVPATAEIAFPSPFKSEHSFFQYGSYGNSSMLSTFCIGYNDKALLDVRGSDRTEFVASNTGFEKHRYDRCVPDIREASTLTVA